MGGFGTAALAVHVPGAKCFFDVYVRIAALPSFWKSTRMVVASSGSQVGEPKAALADGVKSVFAAKISDDTLGESDWSAAHPPRVATSSELVATASTILGGFTEAPEGERVVLQSGCSC